MDLRKLKTLIDLVETSGIAELEIQEGEERVRITRAVAQGPTVYAQPPMQHPSHGLGAGRGGPIEGADHRALHDVAFLRRDLQRRARRGGGGRGGRRHGDHRLRRRRGIGAVGARDAHALLALLDLEFRDTGRLDELNQRLELAQVHGYIPEMSDATGRRSSLRSATLDRRRRHCIRGGVCDDLG